MTIRPFETLDRLRQRMAEAVIAQSGLRHPTLAGHLRRTLTDQGNEGGLIRPAVLEGAFPFEPASETLGQLAGNLLDPRTVDALAGDDSGNGYSFPRNRNPYLHQLKAWQALNSKEPRSAVITAGTGSGKTECFLVPLLDSLYRRTERIVGVEAIMLYPLNALIASQQERLDAWTKPAGGRIRYCLYNGNLPKTLASHAMKAALSAAPQMVPERETLRKAPPPLLVTNLTMLEYMLVRPEDRPIIEASKGRLKWIVLDEAHTLVGSAAAEVALLLRRVMEAFEVDPANVRFVATSATIGEGPAIKEQLRHFLAQIGGIDESRVEFISGDRCLPQRSGTGGRAPDAALLRDLAPDDLYDRLATHDPIWNLIEKLKSRPVPSHEFDSLGESMGVDGQTLAMAMTRARSKAGETLAPLRVHSFHRSLPGLWCCTNPNCRDSIGDDWSAGRVLFEREEACPTCKMPVAELHACNECGEAFMMAEETGDRLLPPRNLPPSDEFLFEAKRDANERDQDDEDGEAVDDETTPSVFQCFSLTGGGLMPLFVDTATGRTADGSGEGRYRLSAHAGGGKGPCPACGASKKTGDKLYPFRFGAPFIIGNAAPILLSSMPHNENVRPPALPQTPPDLPESGRQLISFTDSRQGTARIAAKLQIDSEHAFVRSFIYQAVQHRAAGSGETEETIKLRKNISDVKNRSGWQDDALFAGLVAGWEKELAEKSGGGTLPWTDLRKALAERVEVREWLPEVWGDRADLFKKSTASAASQLAEALLLREMMRRPKLANAPETLGIARLVFPAIDKLEDSQVPSGFRHRGSDLKDWKAWLTTLVMFSIRSNLAVNVHRDVLQWIMRKGFPKSLAGPDLDPSKWQQRWPRSTTASKQPAVVELLRLGLGLNTGSQADRMEMNDWLDKAWHQLQSLLSINESGERALDFGRLEIGALKEAFHCPVTRRIIDVAPFGLTPYARTKLDRADPIAMPTFPADGDEVTRRAFVAHDETVGALRQQGLWTDLNDRIALFSPYARSAEHSAQLSPRRLRAYEAEFKAGRINLLNCSTTMEMGVDIGSVNGVMMTNVPPSIANYRQRVGRAGRRGQPLSLAFTFAKDRPLDREAFRDPATYLGRSIAAPRVALDSRPIVQRHVNAYLLSQFLAIHRGNALRMQAGTFFGCSETPQAHRTLKEERPVSLFAEWLSKATTVIDHEKAIGRLVRGSILAGRSDLTDECARILDAAENDFVREWHALQEQVPDAAVIGATGAIESHLKRLCREFLLSDLADRGFLPGHGFPNHVVSFELDTKDIDENGEDRRGQRHGGPKRPLDIAIRDYAPGSETVVDGQVYRVGGVTLNWHRPSNEDGVREVQALRWSARCGHCGDNWTGAGAWPDLCRTCGEAEIKIESYLKPAGFLRDRHVDVHAEVDQVDYVRPEAARMSAGSAAWEALSQPTAGRFRVNRRGTVFYHTKGPQQEGYDLCLRCGRMEPVARGLADHKPLRARESFMQPCEGNDQIFAIRHAIHLGHEIHTDVFELQPAETPDLGAANAIAIAMREALARHLGIGPDEMGYGVAPSRNAMANSSLSIYLHDRAAGGAGYVVRTAEALRSILKSARAILDCPQNCAHACSSCVLVSDAPEREDDLDRHRAMSFMDRHLSLPDLINAEDAFSAGADISERPLQEIDEWLNNRGGANLTVWADVQDIVELDGWRPSAMFKRWTGNGRKVTLVLPIGTIAGLDGAQVLFLRDYASRNGVAIAEGAPPVFQNGTALFAYADDGKSGHGWGSRDVSVMNIAADWGANHALPIARAQVQLTPDLKLVDHSELKPAAGAAVVVLDVRFDGAIKDFGKRMGKAIRDAASQCGVPVSVPVKQVMYHDRYARSPIVLKLLADTVSSLSSSTKTPLSIMTAADRAGGFSRHNLTSDIEDDSALWAFAQSYGSCCNLDIDLVVGQPLHKRSLSIHFDSGRDIVVDLDQGFGWLVYEGPDKFFNPDDLSDHSARKVSELSGKVRRRHGDSQMVVWRR